MGVVAAGVADPVDFRSKRQVGFFLHGKGVHVCPQAYGFARFAAAENAQHTGFGGPGYFDVAETPEQAVYIGRRFEFPEGQLGVFVDVSPPFDYLAGNGLHIRRGRLGLQAMESLEQEQKSK